MTQAEPQVIERSVPEAEQAASTDRRNRSLAVTAGLVGLLAIAVRIPGAIRDAFWQDEIASVHVLIKSTPWGMVHQVARTEGTPPIWYAVGWLANQIGISPHDYRGMSVLAGGVIAAGTVVIARRLLPLWAAATAGLLVAFGWQFVMHGRELRAYELFAALTVVFAECLLRHLDSRPQGGAPHRWTLPVAVAIASLTNYFFVLSLFAAAAWVWTEPTLRARRATVVRQFAVGLIPFLLWSPIMVHQYLGSRFSWIGPFTVRGLLDTYWELFVHHLPSVGGVLFPTLLLLAVLAGSARLAVSPTGRLLALLTLAPVALTALFWAAGAKVFDPRNLIAVGPFAAIALAQLPATVVRPVGVAAAGAGIALVLVGTVVAEATPPTPYNTIGSDLVRAGWRPNDPILLYSSFGSYFAYRGPLEWYLPHDPYLGLGKRRGHARCAGVFVIAPTVGERARIQRSGQLTASSIAAGVLVGRLSSPQVPTGRVWRGTHILVGRGRPACVRLIPESRIVATLQR